MLSAAQSHSPSFLYNVDAQQQIQHSMDPDHDVNLQRKRKAGESSLPQENERLSKRLSLLNIEKDGDKVYVPVEAPSSSLPSSTPNDTMQVDDTKHKVYIYSIDDELADDPPSPSAGDNLVFLPDIEKHLRQTRVPALFMPKEDSDTDQKQVVLYTDPKSITVPEDKDSVRKAIVEARRRMREKAKEKKEQEEKKKKAEDYGLSVDGQTGEEEMELD